MYYFISVSKDYPNSYWLEYDRSTDLESVIFLSNNRIFPLKSTPIFFIRKKISVNRFRNYDIVMTDAVSIFSERLASVFRRFAYLDVQLIPSHVYHGSEFIGEYYIPIYLKVIDCIDWEKSIYDEKFNFFKKLDILPNSLGNNRIVKALGYEYGEPIIQDMIYDECMKMGIRGCSFYKNPYINPLFNS